MLLKDVPAGGTARITVIIGTEKLEFSTTIIRPADRYVEQVKEKLKCMLVEVIRVDNKLLTLPRGDGILYVVQSFVEEAGKMFEWTGVIPQLMALRDGSKVLVLRCNNPGKAINRRQNFRIWLGHPGTAQFGISPITYNVVVKDISAGGVSLVINKEWDDRVPMNSLVRLMFQDEDTEQKFDLRGLVVRKEDVQEDRILYGVKFTSANPIVNVYIREKERLELKKKSEKLERRRDDKDTEDS